MTSSQNKERLMTNHVAAACGTNCEAQSRDLHAMITMLREENERLRSIVDMPDPIDFVHATEAEARHQRMRWVGDGGKTDADWFWLIGYLAGKALHNPGDDEEKRLHRITTVASAACNWHAARMGVHTGMRAGITEPDKS
jgi:hypothetical protein